MKSPAEKVLPAPAGRWVVLAGSLSVVGAALSVYLLWGSLTRERLPGCGLESGCNVVLHSRWATWFGIPVSAFALCLYALIMVNLTSLKRSNDPSVHRRAGTILFGAGVAVAAAAIWFISLQMFVIRAICPFCMTAHVAGLLTSLVLFANAPRAVSSANMDKAFTPAGLRKCALGGLALVVVLVIGQIVQPYKTYDVQPLAGNALVTTHLAAPEKPGESSRSGLKPGSETAVTGMPAKPHRMLQLHGNLFSLDLNEVPLHGSPEAKNVIVHLFDYSCKHCRQLHPILSEAVRGLSNQIAVVSLPMPLDAHCNHLIKTPIPDHTNACAYAKTGLAVWRADPEKLEEFDDWIFAPDRPPPLDEVHGEAMRLVGTNAFEAALRDPWIDQQVNLSIRLYETNYVRYRRSQLPEMMIGKDIVSGVPPSVEVFYHFLASKLNVQPPGAGAGNAPAQ